MGGLFGSSPPAPPPLPEPVDTDAKERERRLEEMERRRRGRSGTIATGYRGVLSQGERASDGGKTLLGE